MPGNVATKDRFDETDEFFLQAATLIALCPLLQCPKSCAGAEASAIGQ